MKESQMSCSRTPSNYGLIAILLALLILPGGSLLISQDNKQQPAATDAGPDPATIEPDLRNRARQAITNQQWKEAAEAYTALTEQNPNDGGAWFMLGYSLHADRQLEKAVTAHQRASEFPQVRPTALYNLACARALLDQSEQALAALDRAIEAGFRSPKPIAEDPDFVTLLDDPKFQELAELSKPPGTGEVYRQFDFWVGKWDVFGRNGQKVGTNTISKDQNGFLLTERWTNSGGSTGTSINYYNPSERKWKQTWIDAGGNIVKYSGEFQDGTMQLQGESIQANGQKLLCRVKFTPRLNGSVRQHIEHSRDDGETWTTYFDGTYVRQSESEETQDTSAG